MMDPWTCFDLPATGLDSAPVAARLSANGLTAAESITARCAGGLQGARALVLGIVQALAAEGDDLLAAGHAEAADALLVLVNDACDVAEHLATL